MARALTIMTEAYNFCDDAFQANVAHAIHGYMGLSLESEYRIVVFVCVVVHLGTLSVLADGRAAGDQGWGGFVNERFLELILSVCYYYEHALCVYSI